MVYQYDNTMPNALQLTGVAGALNSILKTYLVTGAGAGSVSTLTVSAGVATATYAAGHPFKVGGTALFAGSTPAALNGLKKVLTARTNAITFAAPGVPDGAATGSITSKLAAAGWSELYPGTANVLALKPSVPEATGCVVRLDDANAQNARVRAYESMSDASTGSGMFPLDAQVNGGLFWPKSGSAGATARPWFLIADERGFYLAVAPQGGDRYTLLYCGDIASFKSGDAYAYLVTGNQADQTAVSTVPDGCCGYSHRSARGGAYVARSHTGTGGALAVQRVGGHHNGPTADVYAGAAGYGYGTYPNGPNSGLMTGSLELFALGIRGVLPGLHHPIQDLGGAFASGTIVDGTDDLAGRSLMAIRTGPPASGAAGTVFIDLTGPWVR